ncbi:hypothetical protein BKA65DRAFT_484008 [Rhexocercosporidium sp. MPI-PUGE-AT-0058]|nr:hypothetical protein BKA65DRAFT_484008 [Rhexocercosporidium sp. MPI-PUGE-AT-0058]
MKLLYSSTLIFLIQRALADLEVHHKDPNFDAGNYGVYLVQTSNNIDIISPRLNFLQSTSKCEDRRDTFLTPRGGATKEASAMILDSVGNLYLTFWAAYDAVKGFKLK